ncbi:MAG: response regulator [Anaerolineales bacterium]|nr:response regulator [Anaerolineales bacterium]
MPKILLLEDDRDMTMLLTTLLEIEGYTVRSYDSKRPAAAQAEEDKPDLVFLDVHLGGKDGIQILREMKANPALEGMRVVMTSGINLTDECLAAGANAFLVKPYMPENLLHLLSKVLAAPADQIHREEGAKPSASASFQKFL